MSNIPGRIMKLRETLEQVFAADTAVPGTDWKAYLPSQGHCAAVAVIIYQKFGGEFLHSKVEGQSHWYNRIPNGSEKMEVDLTADQFAGPSMMFSIVPPCQPLYTHSKVRLFDEINDETILRSQLLLERVLAIQGVI